MGGRTGPRIVTIVYGASAVVLLAAAVVEALLLRSQLSVPGSVLMSADLYDQVLRDHLRHQVLLIGAPLVAAAANVVVPRLLGDRRVVWHRVALAGPWVWLVGVVLIEVPWRFAGGGWFNYAPDAEVVLYGPEPWTRTVVGLGGVLACVGLAMTLATLLASAIGPAADEAATAS